METTYEDDGHDDAEAERSGGGPSEDTDLSQPPDTEHAEQSAGAARRARRRWTMVLAGVAAAALGGTALFAGVSGDGEVPAPGAPCPESGGERDTDALLRCVRPSMALLETPLATGSGVLVEGRYVVTNAHVVEPFDSTTVVFPDGERHEEVPVLGVDFHADVALVGPLDTARRPLLVVRGVPAADTDLFLVGYPGDVDDDPEPVIASGALSRIRRLAEHGFTYLQTDATIADGESGGAVIDADGSVLGLSGLSTDDGESTVALSGTDILRSMARIRDGEVPPYRPLPEDPGVTSTTLEFPAEENVWPLTMRTGSRARTVRLTIPAETRPGVLVTDLYGDDLIFVNQEAVDAIERDLGEPFGVEPDAPVAPGVFEFALPARSYARIELRTRLPEGTRMPVESTVPFNVVADFDNDQPVRIDESLRGVLDPLEVSDAYLLELRAGETVEIFAGSAYGDVAFEVRAPGQSAADALGVDDSDIGLSGLDARARYEAETPGTYRITVLSAEWRPTGYVLRVTSVGPSRP